MCTTRISYQLLNLKSVCLISESYDTLSLTLSYNPPCMSLSPSLIVGVCIHRTPNKLSILNLNSVCIISVCYNYDTMSSLSLGYCLLSWENFFLYHLSFIILNCWCLCLGCKSSKWKLLNLFLYSSKIKTEKLTGPNKIWLVLGHRTGAHCEDWDIYKYAGHPL